ncbi:MAG: DUF4430 domain-containing protein [Clostridia bacterium]|nr:DUF4430 domain-containing protein [Clostridia bacterium]
MKKTLSVLLALCCVCSLLVFVSCDDSAEAPSELWQNATYTEDVTLGTGDTTVTILIEAEGKSITVTLKTNKEKLGDAMFEVGLVEDASFFSTLNGMEAKWTPDQAWWAYYQGDTMMNYGVNDTVIENNAQYRFVYTK